jgi:PAS domain S-box-containing protein
MKTQIQLKDISLLYVEDDDFTREDLLDFLRWEFDTVYAAKNGKEGLELFEQNNPDIVITDIRMPVMDGLEMTSHIRGLNPDAPVIITTAYSDLSYIMKAIELGVDGYILKPILHEALLKTIYKTAVYKRADKLLRANEKRLRDITSSLDEGVYALDRSGRVVFMNETAEDMLGYIEEELMGRDMHRMTHYQKKDGSPLPIEECMINKSIKTGKRYIVEDDVFTRKDGSMLFVRYIATPTMEETAISGCVTAFRRI